MGGGTGGLLPLSGLLAFGSCSGGGGGGLVPPSSGGGGGLGRRRVVVILHHGGRRASVGDFDPDDDGEDAEEDAGGQRQQPAHGRLTAVERQAHEERFVVLGVGVGLRGRGAVGGGRGRDGAGAAGLAAVNQGVHALPGRRRHEGRLAEDEGEDLVGGGDLGEVDVGLQARLLDLGDLFGRQRVVEVVGDGVGLEGVGAGGGRRGQAAAPRHLLDAGDQLLGRVALGDLLADVAWSRPAPACRRGRRAGFAGSGARRSPLLGGKAPGPRPGGFCN